jgi:hypothetical protein
VSASVGTAGSLEASVQTVDRPLITAGIAVAAHRDAQARS